jgi:UDP:flavonoid glycosyltransferase YjiC (YdhE family)
VRVLFATTANDGHFGPVLPFARACVNAGHDVRVAAPGSLGDALTRAGLQHEPFGEPLPEVIGPVMGRLPTLTRAAAQIRAGWRILPMPLRPGGWRSPSASCPQPPKPWPP